MTKIIIKDYPSPFFPILCSWNQGKNSSVFSSLEDAKRHMIGRFGNVVFVDHRKTV